MKFWLRCEADDGDVGMCRPSCFKHRSGIGAVEQGKHRVAAVESLQITEGDVITTNANIVQG